MMISDLLMATERLKTEKTFLSDMIIKLVSENQLLLRENKYFREELRSRLFPHHCMKRSLDDIETEDGIKISKPKGIKSLQEKLYVSRMCECQHAVHREHQQLCECQFALHQEHRVSTCCAPAPNMANHGLTCCDSTLISDSVRCHHHLHSLDSRLYLDHGKIHLRCWEKMMKERRGDFFKEQLRMLEIKAALTEQRKHTESLQRKINHLQELLEHSELHAALQAKELRKSCCCCRSWMYEVDIGHLGSQIDTADKRNYVYIWQTNAPVRISDSDMEKQGPESAESIDKFKKESLKESRDNVLIGPQDSKERRKSSEVSEPPPEEHFEESPEPPPEEHFEESPEPPPEEHFKESPEASKHDINDWPEKSLSNLKEEGPETPHLSAQELREPSLKSIPNLQVSEVKPQVTKNLSKDWLIKSLSNIKKKSSIASQKNIVEWLQASMKSLEDKYSEGSMPNLEESLKESFKKIEEEYPETSRQDVKEWIETSINNLKDEGPETCHLSAQEWHEESIKAIQDLLKESSRALQPDVKEESETLIQVSPSHVSIKEWTEQSLEDLKKRSSEMPKESLDEWLNASIKSLQEQHPEASIQDVKEWLESAIKISLKSLQEDASKEEAHKPSEASVSSILEEEEEEEEEISTDNVQESLESSTKDIENHPEESLASLQKESQMSHLSTQEWLEASMESIPEKTPETSREKMEELIQEESLRNLTDESPEISKESVPEEPEETFKTLENLVVPQRSRESIQKKASELSVQERPEADMKTTEEEGHDISQQSLQQSLKSIDNLTEIYPEESLTEQEPDERSKQSLHEEASLPTVPQWLEESLEHLLKQDPELSSHSIKDWLEESCHKLLSEGDFEDVQKWIETVIDKLPEKDSELFRKSFQELLKSSLKSLKQESLAEPVASKSLSEAKISAEKLHEDRSKKSALKDYLLSLVSWYRNHPEEFFKTILRFLIPLTIFMILYRHYKLYCVPHGGLKRY